MAIAEMRTWISISAKGRLRRPIEKERRVPRRRHVPTPETRRSQEAKRAALLVGDCKLTADLLHQAERGQHVLRAADLIDRLRKQLNDAAGALEDLAQTA